MNSDTPRTDADCRQYPSPEYAQRIIFEGCECVVLAPEDYESLYEHARTLERELSEMTKERDALRADAERGRYLMREMTHQRRGDRVCTMPARNASGLVLNAMARHAFMGFLAHAPGAPRIADV